MLITIARFSFPYEAHIAKSRLASEGIPAYVVDEHTISMQWLYSNALGGVRLQVPKDFEVIAQEILNVELEETLVEQQGWDGNICPKCGSRETEYYQFGKRMAFLVFIGIEFPLFPTSDGIICKKCGSKSKI